MRKRKKQVAEVDLKNISEFHLPRACQGHNFADVLHELERRLEGEYVLGSKERARQFVRGRTILERRFLFSAVLNDFLKETSMSTADLLELTGCVARDEAGGFLADLLDPFPFRKNRTIESHPEIDKLFPGKSIEQK